MANVCVLSPGSNRAHAFTPEPTKAPTSCPARHAGPLRLASPDVAYADALAACRTTLLASLGSTQSEVLFAPTPASLTLYVPRWDNLAGCWCREAGWLGVSVTTSLHHIASDLLVTPAAVACIFPAGLS